MSQAELKLLEVAVCRGLAYKETRNQGQLRRKNKSLEKPWRANAGEEKGVSPRDVHSGFLATMDSNVPGTGPKRGKPWEKVESGPVGRW